MEIANLGADVFFWFYSTIVQAFLGLLALLGIFIIFRLQDQRMRIQESYAEGRRTLLRNVKGQEQLERLSDEGVLEELERNKGTDKCKKDLEKIKTQEDIPSNLRKKVFWPIILIILNIVISLFFLLTN